MKMRQTNNRGVTLVELMVALAVLAMLMTAVIMLMSNNTVIYKKTKADISVQTTAHETYSAIQDSIMQAKYIELKGYEDPLNPVIVTYKKGSLIKPGDAATGFDTLKKVTKSGETTTTTFTRIYPVQLTVVYSVESADNLENKNCTVTYTFHRYIDPEDGMYTGRHEFRDTKKNQKCNLYVTRTYEDNPAKDSAWTDTTNTSWNPTMQGDSTKANRDTFQEWLYTSALSEAIVQVDSSTQSFDLILDFWDRGQKYNTSGVVSCRNSYVMNDMRSRTAAATPESTEDSSEDDSEESTGSGH